MGTSASAYLMAWKVGRITKSKQFPKVSMANPQGSDYDGAKKKLLYETSCRGGVGTVEQGKWKVEEHRKTLEEMKLDLERLDLEELEMVKS